MRHFRRVDLYATVYLLKQARHPKYPTFHYFSSPLGIKEHSFLSIVMTGKNYDELLEAARNLPDIFELVKQGVQEVTGHSRPGLMLGLADLGEGAHAWVGGFHVVASNAIIMNSRPMDHVHTFQPDLYKPYVFFVLLHEYLHTLGYFDEAACRAKTNEVANALFGTSHVVTRMTRKIEMFLPQFSTMKYGWMPPQNPIIQYVRGFDRSSVSYII